jgi:hypothetical protein
MAEQLNIPIEVTSHGKLTNYINSKKLLSPVLKCSELKFKSEEEFDQKIQNSKLNIVTVIEGISDPQNLGTTIRNTFFIGTNFLVGIDMSYSISFPTTLEYLSSIYLLKKKGNNSYIEQLLTIKLDPTKFQNSHLL